MNPIDFRFTTDLKIAPKRQGDYGRDAGNFAAKLVLMYNNQNPPPQSEMVFDDWRINNHPNRNWFEPRGSEDMARWIIMVTDKNVLPTISHPSKLFLLHDPCKIQELKTANGTLQRVSDLYHQPFVMSPVTDPTINPPAGAKMLEGLGHILISAITSKDFLCLYTLSE
jgi:hypothetical protein